MIDSMHQFNHNSKVDICEYKNYLQEPSNVNQSVIIIVSTLEWWLTLPRATSPISHRTLRRCHHHHTYQWSSQWQCEMLNLLVRTFVIFFGCYKTYISRTMDVMKHGSLHSSQQCEIWLSPAHCTVGSGQLQEIYWFIFL